MNWEAIGAVAELVGALGVVASLAYLAVQIRSNTRSAQAATYQGLAQSVRDINREVFTSSETAGFLERALTTEVDFDPVEQCRWLAFRSAQFRHYDNVFHQHQMGSLRDSEFRSLTAVAHFSLRSARLRQAWRGMRGMFDDPYRSFIDEIAARAERSPPAV